MNDLKEKMEYRRFILKRPEKEKALLALIEAKGLTRNDLILILQTISLNEQLFDTV